MRTASMRRFPRPVALAVGVLLLGGCAGEGDKGGDESAARPCFPTPSTGVTRAPAGAGLTTRLGSPDAAARRPGGGDTHGGADTPNPRPGEEHNGAATQGPALAPTPGEREQGSTLQGPSLAPTPGEREQGSTLQGPSLAPTPGEREQGSTLQGPHLAPNPGEQDQGTTLQGPPQGAKPAGASQGALVQGLTTPGPKPEMETQGRVFGFQDINGVTLGVRASGAPVALVGGALVADGLANTEAMRGVALVATTAGGERFAVEVVAVERAEGVERVQILIDGVAACAPGDQGVFVEGAWDARGTHVAGPGTFTYSCMRGVIAKCVEWGYAPWRVGAPRHAACTRLARADYCGDGNPWTVDGTAVGLNDTLGVSTFASGDGFTFEAAWGPGGAVCVNETRYAVTDRDGNTVRPSCLAALPTCRSLDEAQQFGAELANDSAHAAIDACE